MYISCPSSSCLGIGHLCLWLYVLAIPVKPVPLKAVKPPSPCCYCAFVYRRSYCAALRENHGQEHHKPNTRRARCGSHPGPAQNAASPMRMQLPMRMPLIGDIPNPDYLCPQANTRPFLPLHWYSACSTVAMAVYLPQCLLGGKCGIVRHLLKHATVQCQYTVRGEFEEY